MQMQLKALSNYVIQTFGEQHTKNEMPYGGILLAQNSEINFHVCQLFVLKLPNSIHLRQIIFIEN